MLVWPLQRAHPAPAASGTELLTASARHQTAEFFSDDDDGDWLADSIALAQS